MSFHLLSLIFFLCTCFICDTPFYFCTFFLEPFHFRMSAHLFLISWCSVLYSLLYLGIGFCLVFIMSIISSVIHFFFISVFVFGMISIADTFKASLNVSNLVFPFTLCLFYLLLTLSIYFSYIFGSLKNLSYCNLTISNFCSFTQSLDNTRKYSFLQLALGSIFCIVKLNSCIDSHIADLVFPFSSCASPCPSKSWMFL